MLTISSPRLRHLSSFCLVGLLAGCAEPQASDSPPWLATETQALGVEHTVCPSGCEYSSPAACAIGATVTAGDICLVKGGEYRETVTFEAGKLKARLVFRCEPGQHCLIDGEGIRDYGFDCYDDWVIEGFEITNTRLDAISAYRRVNTVRDCYIHDVGRRAIEMLSGLSGTPTLIGVAERNIIENTWETGIALNAPYGPIEVRNNLIINSGLGGGSGISCGAQAL